MKKKSWIEEKFGKPCKCGKRHDTIATIGENLPKVKERCKEEENKTL